MDIIIGAGVTGLSYANFTKNDYLIIEKDSIPGGYCKTIFQDGFTWDYSGHFFHFNDEKIKKYIFDNMDSDEILSIKKNTKIYLNNNYIDFPFQKNIHQLPKENFINALIELYLISLNENNSSKNKNFKEMIIDNYGLEICNSFLIPYNEKLYATDLNNLDSNAMGRFFPSTRFHDVLLNMKSTNNESYNNNFIYPTGGAYEYIKALLKNIPEEKILFNTTITNIDLNKKEILMSDGKKFNFNNLVSTIPLPSLLGLANIRYSQENFTSNKVKVFNLGFDRPSQNKEHWIYYPSKKLIFYRVGFYNNILNSNRMSLYVEIGDKSASPKEDEPEKLLDLVINDLKKVGIISDQTCISWNYLEMNPAYVHINEKSEYEKNFHFKNLEKNNVYSIGRYGEWKYCSIEDNIKDAILLAEKLS